MEQQQPKKKRGNPNPYPASRFQKSQKQRQITVGFRIPADEHASLEQVAADYAKVSATSAAKLIFLEALKHPELLEAALGRNND